MSANLSRQTLRLLCVFLLCIQCLSCTVTVEGDLSGSNSATYYDEEKLNITWWCSSAFENDTLSLINHDTTITRVLWDQHADNITQSQGDVLHELSGSSGNFSVVIGTSVETRAEVWFHSIQRPKMFIVLNPCVSGAPCIAEGNHPTGLKNEIQYSVALYAAPTSNVTVDISLPISTYGGYEMSISHSSLHFTPENYQVGQEITIASIDDDYREDNQLWEIRHTSSSADNRYDGLILAFEVLAVDDDRSGVNVDMYFSNVTGSYISAADDSDSITRVILREGVEFDSFEKSCEASTAQARIKLLSKPRSPVTLTLVSKAQEAKPTVSDLLFDVQNSKQVLQFTTDNWNVMQEVSVGVQNDGESFGDWEAHFTVESSSSDQDYQTSWVGDPLSSTSGVLMYGVVGAPNSQDAGPIVASNGWVPVVVKDDDRSGMVIDDVPETTGATRLEEAPDAATWRFLGEGAHSLRYEIMPRSLPNGLTFVVFANNCSVEVEVFDLGSTSLQALNSSEAAALAALSARTIIKQVPLLAVNGVSSLFHAIQINASDWEGGVSVAVEAFDDEQKLYEENTRWCTLRHFVASDDPNFADETPFNMSYLQTALAEPSGEAMADIVASFDFETPNGYFNLYPEHLEVLVSANDTETRDRLDSARGEVYNDMCGRYPLTQRTDAVLNIVLMDDDSSFMTKFGANVASRTVGTICLFLVIGTWIVGTQEIWKKTDEIVTKREELKAKETQKAKEQRSSIARASFKRGMSKKQMSVAKIEKVVDEEDVLKEFLGMNRLEEQQSKTLSHATYLYLLISELQFLVFLSQTNAVAQHSVVLRVFAQGFWWSNFQVAVAEPHYTETNLYQSDRDRAIRFDALFINTLVCFSLVLFFASTGRFITRQWAARYLNSKRSLAKVAVEPILVDEAVKAELERETARMQSLSRKLTQRSQLKLMKNESKAKLALGENYLVDEAANAIPMIHESPDENSDNVAEEDGLSEHEKARRLSMHESDVQSLRWKRLTTPWLWELPVLLMGFTGILQASAMAFWRHMLTGIGILGMLVGTTYGIGLLVFSVYRIRKDVVQGKVVTYEKKQHVLRSDIARESADQEDDGDEQGTKERRSSSVSISEIAHFIPGLAHHTGDQSDVFGWWVDHSKDEEFLLKFGLLVDAINGARKSAIYHYPIQMVRQIAAAMVFAIFSSTESAYDKKSQVMFLAAVEGTFMIIFLLRPAFRSPTANFYFLISALAHFGCCFGSAWLVDGSVLGFSFQRDFIEKCIVSVSMFIVLVASLLQMNDVFHQPLVHFYNTKLTKWFTCLPSERKKLKAIREIDLQTKGHDEVLMEDLLLEARKLGYDIENPIETILADEIKGSVLRPFNSESSMLRKDPKKNVSANASTMNLTSLAAPTKRGKKLDPIPKARLSGQGAGLLKSSTEITKAKRKKTFLAPDAD